MKILYKISGAILLLLLISGFSIFLITKTNNSQKELFMKTLSEQLQKSFSIIASVSSQRHEMPTIDYSEWDQMYDYINNPDPDWARINIGSMLLSYEVNAAWVVDTSNSTIYKAKDHKFAFDKVIDDPSRFLNGIKEKHTIKTFLDIDNTLIEVFGTTIHRTADSLGCKNPRGYLFVAKIWDKEYISQMEEFTASEISLVRHKPLTQTVVGDSIVVFNEIINSSGSVVAYARIAQPAEYIQSNKRLSNSIFIIFFITAFLAMTIVIYSLISWLGKPLYYMELILKGNREKIDRLKMVGYEYVHIAELMEQSETIKEELAVAKERAEESNKLKTVFLQNMTHEFRTPLNAIIGFSQLIEGSYGNREELKFYSSCIYHSGSELLRFANEILDVSRLESGKMPVYMEEFILKDVLNEVELYFNNLNNSLNKTSVKLSVKNRCADNKMIITDKNKLIHVLNNLVHNALKFTPAGLIEIGCSESSNQTLTFYVSDTGIGIEEDKLTMIFEKFHQIDDGLSRNYGGSGLGLSIVKSFLELIGGTIHVSSVKGQGTIFSFIIPDKKQ